MWQSLSSFVLTPEWQTSKLTTATNFRLTHTFDLNESEYQPMALIALARLDEHNRLEIFSPQRIVPREESEIIQFSLLPFKWEYSIATKLLVVPSRISSQWSLQIDMPLYSTTFNPDLSGLCDTYHSKSMSVSGSDYFKLLSVNNTRRKFRIVNLSGQPVYIGITQDFSPGSCLTAIPPQGIYVDDINWLGEVYANKFSSDTSQSDLQVWEYGLGSEYIPPVEPTVAM